jgi:DNA-binding winged helix-turn-helix (wHTH) protein
MAIFCFDQFQLDCPGRQLTRDGANVELSPRYFDALALLVREQGRLVSKDRFMAEVWRGVPVTDEALTQCIKTLRKQLGDDAANPRFIETVPKHGYRFLPQVTATEESGVPRPLAAMGTVLRLGGAGAMGGAGAGVIGGLIYGFVSASQPAGEIGALSVLLVLMCFTGLVALLGGAGVSFGIAAARKHAGGASAWDIAGGATGGLLVGAFVKLLGLDGFRLLLGHAPGDITGAAEGLALGGAVGAGAWLASRVTQSLRVSVTIAALCGAAAGLVIPLLGGRLMAGSLDLMARSFPDSRFRLDRIGALLGEDGFGPVSQVVTGGLEGALFGGCIVGAMLMLSRYRGSARP